MAEAKKEKTTAKKEAVAKENGVDLKDAEKNKGMAMLAYLIFFLPLVTDAKDSDFAKFHANQGLILLIFSVVFSPVASAILGITIIGIPLIPLVPIVPIIFFIMGLVNASKLEKKELPLIGGIHILDK